AKPAEIVGDVARKDAGREPEGRDGGTAGRDVHRYRLAAAHRRCAFPDVEHAVGADEVALRHGEETPCARERGVDVERGGLPSSAAEVDLIYPGAVAEGRPTIEAIAARVVVREAIDRERTADLSRRSGNRDGDVVGDRVVAHEEEVVAHLVQLR